MLRTNGWRSTRYSLSPLRATPSEYTSATLSSRLGFASAATSVRLGVLLFEGRLANFSSIELCEVGARRGSKPATCRCRTWACPRARRSSSIAIACAWSFTLPGGCGPIRPQDPCSLPRPRDDASRAPPRARRANNCALCWGTSSGRMPRLRTRIKWKSLNPGMRSPRRRNSFVSV